MLTRLYWHTTNGYGELVPTTTHLADAPVAGIYAGAGTTFCGLDFQHARAGQGPMRVCLRCRRSWQRMEREREAELQMAAEEAAARLSQLRYPSTPAA